MEVYNNLSSYLKVKYGKRLKKICIDGGFSCPNRDGTVGFGGCIFCGERGAGEHIKENECITERVKSAITDDDSLYIAYFQNFSNTHASCEVLKERYDAALISDRIKILAIGTRPDCIDEEKAELISRYMKQREVWVELGLQSSSDETAKIINRGYQTKKFEEAVEILNRYGVPVIAHIIIGLPKESETDVKNTVDFINRQPINGLKIHSIYVMENTVLAEMYKCGEYTPPTRDEYERMAIYALTHVSPELIIHRITGDCPKGMLVAPDWNEDKNAVISSIQNTMKKEGLYQGIFYGK